MPSTILQHLEACHWRRVTVIERLLNNCVDDLVSKLDIPDLKSCPGKVLHVLLTFMCQDSNSDMSIEDFTLKT